MDQMLSVVAYELTLFAVVGFLIGGIDDLIVDLIWIVRSIWRRIVIYPLHVRANAATLIKPSCAGRIIIFIAAWDESAVIGRMLSYAGTVYDHDDYRIYVGCYPNDPATIAAVQAVKLPHVHIVVGDHGIR
jgi:bacteriophage N4 adsorption protein B